MTKFQRDLFRWDGMYLMYGPSMVESKFIARFKYRAPKQNAAAFRNFLIKHFTVEEYFAARERGESPGAILEAKGYVSPNVRWCRKMQAKADAARCPTVLNIVP